ncbi:MAG: rod shape-determining protein MreD [Bacteroidales bacterium]|nr:rod shape-determining protein MreD [Bacteroidales bacterium]
MSSYIKYIGWFALAVISQVLLFNNISLLNYIVPFGFLWFIIILPIKVNHTLLVLISFLLGYLVDMFSGGVIGLHAAAATMAGFIRPYVLKKYHTAEFEYDSKALPNIKNLGVSNFVIYSLIIIYTHHLLYYLLEAFSTKDFLLTMFRALLNSVFTLLFILFFQYIQISTKDK